MSSTLFQPSVSADSGVDLETLLASITQVLARDPPPATTEDLTDEEYDTFLQVPEAEADRVPDEGKVLYWRIRARYHQEESNAQYQNTIDAERGLEKVRQKCDALEKSISDQNRAAARTRPTPSARGTRPTLGSVLNNPAAEALRRRNADYRSSLGRLNTNANLSREDEGEDDGGAQDDQEETQGHLGQSTLNGGASFTKEREIMPPKLKTTKAKDWIMFKQSFLNHLILNRWAPHRAIGVLAISLEDEALTAVEHLATPLAECDSLDEALALYEEVFIHRSGTHLARTEFNQASREASESLQTWHTRLRVLFTRAFPNPDDQAAEPQDRALRDRFVLGMGMPAVGDRLMYHESFYDLTYAELLHRAQDIQAIQVQLRANRGGVHQLSTGEGGGLGPDGLCRICAIQPGPAHPCSRCGATDHWKNECDGHAKPAWTPVSAPPKPRVKKYRWVRREKPDEKAGSGPRASEIQARNEGRSGN